MVDGKYKFWVQTKYVTYFLMKKRFTLHDKGWHEGKIIEKKIERQ